MAIFKKIIQIIAILTVAGFMLLAAGKMYFVDGGVDLDKADKITGQITSTYETTKRTTGKYASDVPVFAFTLDNYSHTLGAYRPSKDYTALLKNIRKGDTVTVTYKPMPQDKINIDVYQIEKSGKVILDYDSYKRNHIGASILISVLAIAMVILATLKIIKT
jgi:hypothetical protein